MARTNHRHAPDQRCSVPFCGRPAVVIDLCRLCYQAEFRWSKRTPAERANHVRQLNKFKARMERLRAPHIRRVK